MAPSLCKAPGLIPAAAAWGLASLETLLGACGQEAVQAWPGSGPVTCVSSDKDQASLWPEGTGWVPDGGLKGKLDLGLIGPTGFGGWGFVNK